jgi:hypothetical protein
MSRETGNVNDGSLYQEVNYSSNPKKINNLLIKRGSEYKGGRKHGMPEMWHTQRQGGKIL